MSAAAAYVVPMGSGKTDPAASAPSLSRRRRSTVRSLMIAGLDGAGDVAQPGAGATWGEAADRADALLQEERAAGVHPIRKYVGLNAMERQMYHDGFTPRCRCCRVYQYVGGLLLVPGSFVFLRALGFHLFSQIAMAVCTWNWFVKIPAIGNLYESDTAVVYRLLRMMPDDVRRRSMRRSGLANTSGCVTATTMPLMLLLYGGWFALCGMVELDGFSMVVVVVFWAIMITCPHMFMVSFHFVGLARGLSECIDVLNIFCYITAGAGDGDGDGDGDSGREKKRAVRRVNWRAAFKNYHILYDTVERFSLGFASYFFLAEFFLVLALACLCVSAYVEVTVLVEMPLTSDGDTRAWTMQFLRAGVQTVYAAMYWAIGAAIFSAASSITGSARRIKLEAHRICARVELEDPDSLPIAHRFYDHVDRGWTALGFKSMGIVVSPSLVAKLAYALASLASAALLFLARSV